jgi:hypothetical protein
MAAQSSTPNLFVLQGNGLQVTYATTSIAGEPTFQFNDGQQDQNFSGDAISVVDSDIGAQVTVTTRKSIDADFTTFTLLVPEIVLTGTEVHFSTIGIITLHHFFASAPNLIKGPHEEYHSYDLQGTASFVMF